MIIRAHKRRWTAALGVLAAVLTVGLWAAPAEAVAPYPSAQPTVVLDSGGRLEVFVTDNVNHAVYHNQRATSGNWSGWYSLGGVNNYSGIAAISGAGNRLAVFVLGTDGRIWFKRQSAAGSLTWETYWNPIGTGVFAKPPVVGKNANGKLEVFAASGSGTVYHSVEGTAGAFGGWASLGKTEINYDPDLSVATSPGGRLVLTAGHQFRAQTAPNGGWAGWKNINGVAIDHVSLARVGGNLFGAGLYYNCDLDCDIYTTRWNDATGAFVTAWTGTRGQAHVGPVGIAADGSNPTEAVLGTTGGIYARINSNSCSSSCPAWGRLTNPPGWASPPAIAIASGAEFVFVASSDGNLYYQLRWLPGSGAPEGFTGVWVRP